jgi:hypothetical protein
VVAADIEAAVARVEADVARVERAMVDGVGRSGNLR